MAAVARLAGLHQPEAQEAENVAYNVAFELFSGMEGTYLRDVRQRLGDEWDEVMLSGSSDDPGSE